MPRDSPNLLPLGVEFDDFLFASISEDKDAMPLSVVSAFARLELDPWAEAATLARLPARVAMGRLASTLGNLPEALRVHLDLDRASKRLIDLLPRRNTQGSTPSQQSSDHLTLKTKILALISGVFMVIMILFSFVAAHLQSNAAPQTVLSTTSPDATSSRSDVPQAFP